MKSKFKLYGSFLYTFSSTDFNLFNIKKTSLKEASTTISSLKFLDELASNNFSKTEKTQFFLFEVMP